MADQHELTGGLAGLDEFWLEGVDIGARATGPALSPLS